MSDVGVNETTMAYNKAMVQKANADTQLRNIQAVGEMARNKISQKDLEWYNWKNGVGIAKDVAVGVGSLVGGAGLVKNAKNVKNFKNITDTKKFKTLHWQNRPIGR